MQREEILFYMRSGELDIYQTKSKKEKKIEFDNSLFFEFGEIKNAEEGLKTLSELISSIKLNPFYLKPKLIILYNDICHSDSKFLYKYVLKDLECSEIKFVPLSTIVKKIKDDDRVVVFDKNYYTVIGQKTKIASLDSLDFEPIIIGKKDTNYIHFPDKDTVWKAFKTYFTNSQRCDTIVVGDDEC